MRKSKKKRRVLEMASTEARIEKIENGYIVYSHTKTMYFPKFEEALEFVKKIFTDK